MDLELYKGRKSPSTVAAHHEATRHKLSVMADRLATQARANLAEHHGKTRRRFNNHPSPTIEVQQGKLDYYVVLNAGGDLQRAIGIEYGHRFQPRSKNASGPWNQSGGTGVLGRAADIAVAFGVFE